MVLLEIDHGADALGEVRTVHVRRPWYRRACFFFVIIPAVIIAGDCALIHVGCLWEVSIEERPFDSVRWKELSYREDGGSHARQEMRSDLRQSYPRPGTSKEKVMNSSENHTDPGLSRTERSR